MIFDTVKAFLSGRVPKQLVIQFTDYCNASCPQCSMNKNHRYERSKLDIEAMKKIIDSASVNKIPSVSITGGEPLIFQNELMELLSYAKSKKIKFLRTGTNGFMFADHAHNDFKSNTAKLALKLAEANVRNFWISIDSYIPNIHENIRGFQGLIKGIEKALPIFHANGIYPSANLGINRLIGGLPLENCGDKDFREYFLRSFNMFFEFIISLGFTTVNCCYPMGSESTGSSILYGAVSDNHMVNFSRHERIMIYETLAESIKKYRDRIRIFTPLTALYNLAREESGIPGSYPCRGGRDFFFVDSKTGSLFPCGYRPEYNFGRIWDYEFHDRKHFVCKKCHWECFRDPTEILMPLAEFFSAPEKIISKFAADKKYLSLYFKDLRYYIDCGLFDGRKNINLDKLKKYKQIKIEKKNRSLKVLSNQTAQ